jgi:hypothetical protein
MIGYIAYVPQISDHLRVPVVNIFSLNGTATLLWAYVLTKDFPGN